MAIVKLARASITAFKEDESRLLDTLQALGDVHFADLSVQAADYSALLAPERPDAERSQREEELAAIEQALAILTALEPAPGMLDSLRNGLPETTYAEAKKAAEKLDLRPLCQEIRSKRKALDVSREAIAQERQRKEQWRPFVRLDTAPCALRRLQRVRAALGSIPKRGDEGFRRALIDFQTTYLEVLSTDEKDLYFLLLYLPEEETAVRELLHRFSFSESKLSGELSASAAIAAADAHIEQERVRIGELEAELKALSAAHKRELCLKAEWLRNQLVQTYSRERLVSGREAFVAELYLPEDETDRLEKALAASLQQPYNLEYSVVERDDPQLAEVPTLLRNNALLRPFETLVNTFGVPRYDELDPTAVMMPWYVFCFAMMLGDFGYALVLFLLSTAALKFGKMKAGLRNNVRFFQICSVPAMVVGLLYGSTFALPWPKALISPTENTNEILLLSLAIGLVMLFFGLGVKAWMCARDKDWLAVLMDVFTWYFAVGGILIILFGDRIGIPPLGKTIATVLTVLGLLGIWLFSAREEKSIAGRLTWGLYNVYGMSSWVGDLVSFTRIAALAMSGGFIGYAVNLISKMLFGGGIIGILPGLVVLLVFHGFNIFLSCLSAYVHSLRLIYVEFFGKFFEGGGTLFQRMRAESKYYEIK